MKNIVFTFTILIASFHVTAQTVENEIVRTEHMRSLSEMNVVVASNPSNASVRISAPVGSKCQIISASGTYVGTWHLELEELVLTDIGTGTFLAIIDNGTFVVTRKFVVL